MLRPLLILLVLAMPAYAQNEQAGDLNTSTINTNSTVSSNNPSTTNNYNGAGAASDVTPPPSAIAPSYISNGPETCLVGNSIGTQVNVFGLSGGFYKQDPNCNRRRDAKVLKDLGMNIAAVAMMCQDDEVWLSMYQSGTPCPIMIGTRLVAGRAAYYTMKKNPELFIPMYDKKREYFDATLKLGQNDDEQEGDSSGSISERFRSSLRGD